MSDLWLTWLSPVNFVLALALVGIALIVWRAQCRDDFDWADALRDEVKDGKISVWRVIAFGAFAAMTWALMHSAVEKTLTDGMFLIYGGFWSLTPLGAKIVDKLNWTVGK